MTVAPRQGLIGGLATVRVVSAAVAIPNPLNPRLHRSTSLRPENLGDNCTSNRTDPSQTKSLSLSQQVVGKTKYKYKKRSNTNTATPAPLLYLTRIFHCSLRYLETLRVARETAQYLPTQVVFRVGLVRTETPHRGWAVRWRDISVEKCGPLSLRTHHHTDTPNCALRI